MAGLAEGRLEGGRVGHRGRRGVDDPDAMAEPSGGVRRGLPRRVDDPLQGAVIDARGQPLAGLAGGVGGEGPTPEVDDVAAGDVAVEDLEQEEVDGGDRVEGPSSPAIVFAAAGVGDGVGGEAVGEVLPESVEGGDHTRRDGGPVRSWGVVSNRQGAAGSTHAQGRTSLVGSGFTPHLPGIHLRPLRQPVPFDTPCFKALDRWFQPRSSHRPRLWTSPSGSPAGSDE